jgi:hypothetical protein
MNLIKIIKLSILLNLAILIMASCEKKTEEIETPFVNPWDITLVDSISGSDMGNSNKLALDSEGGIHIAYIEQVGTTNNLKYAYKSTDGEWVKETLAMDLQDDHIDITIDPSDHIFIIYEDGEDECLHIKEKSVGGTFNDVLVDVLYDDDNYPRNYQARYGALFADKNGTIHISFERANYGMRYTTYSFQGAFTDVEISEVIDTNTSAGTSDIVTDSEGNVHIAFHLSDKVIYALKVDSTGFWSNEELFSSDYSQGYETISMVIDSKDNLHMAYYTSDDQRYAFKDHLLNVWVDASTGANCQNNRLDRAIAVDINDLPKIVYSKGATDSEFSLYVASLSPLAIWSHEKIEGNADYRTDSYTDIQIDANNRAHVSYRCRTTGVLKYATRILE